MTFSSTSTGMITSLAWDLDGDGRLRRRRRTDGLALVPGRRRSTPSRSARTWTPRTQQQTITVRNRPPVAHFAFSPPFPADGELVTVASTSVDLDGPIVRYSWDLDGDGAFDDSMSVSASLSLAPGFHRVGLRVLDRDGAADSIYRPIVIASLGARAAQAVPGRAAQRAHHPRRECE